MQQLWCCIAICNAAIIVVQYNVNYKLHHNTVQQLWHCIEIDICALKIALQHGAAIVGLHCKQMAGLDSFRGGTNSQLDIY